MYDPLALDRQRIDQDLLRDRADRADRRSARATYRREPAADPSARRLPALRLALAGLTDRNLGQRNLGLRKIGQRSSKRTDVCTDC